jgi:hypothetical protein
MNTTLVSLQEYLDTAYSPDREYVDGVVVERQAGERPRDGSAADVLEKVLEYAAVGVPNIWVIDPRRRKAFTYSAQRLEQVTGAEMRTGEPLISIPLDEVFFGL